MTMTMTMTVTMTVTTTMAMTTMTITMNMTNNFYHLRVNRYHALLTWREIDSPSPQPFASKDRSWEW